jgi:hypothetical protein
VSSPLTQALNAAKRPHGRLRQQDRKNHATVSEWNKQMASLKNPAPTAGMAMLLPDIYTGKLHARSANCLINRQICSSPKFTARIFWHGSARVRPEGPQAEALLRYS